MPALSKISCRLALVVCLAAAASARADDKSVEFNRDIRPILSDNCFFCHGPDPATREAGLRLDQEDAAKGDNDGVTAIVAGDIDASELIYRIFASDPDELMPPEDSGRHLTAAQKDLLKRWIEQGAQWQEHWAFVAPENIPLPASTVDDPRVQSGNGIDAFVLQRLREEQLEPSPVADRETLIRRVTLDLTGLPPTLAEVDAFLADDSAQAYEKVVDRLLSSPRYGETMALPWLDAARFADSDGYQNDGPRSMWRWRDWVIDAYNRNLPFDQFTIEQLAGDLLPNASLDQKIATGFNRNHRYNSEAGLVLEEFRLENAVDRVDTTSTVWMGLTMGCARCHDHKFDPISTRDYYQLIAFFDNITESGRAIKFGNSEPYITAPTAEQQVRLARLDDALASAEKKLREALAAGPAVAARRRWAEQETVGASAQQRIAEAMVSGQRSLYLNFESPPVAAPSVPKKVAKGKGRAGQATPPNGILSIENGSPVRIDGPLGRAGGFAAADDVFRATSDHRFQTQERWAVAMWIRPDQIDAGVVLSKQTPNILRPGLAIELHDGKLRVYSITRWVAGVNGIETAAPVAAGEWLHVTVVNDGSQRAGGIRLYLDGEPAAVEILHNTNSNTGGGVATTPLLIGGGVHGAGYRGQIDEIRGYDRSLWPDEIAALALQPHQFAESEAAFLADPEGADVPLKALAAARDQARMARQKFRDSLPTTMVMEELPTPRDTFIRNRGVYDDLGEKVEPDVPAVFADLPDDAPRNRLGFARWLVSGEHPLTARVAVNRYWLRYFGTGLVKTAEDFGQQGELPSHPELLDWLAGEFVASGWDVKAMQRLIVTSYTYRQSSALSAELIERDLDNRLLARGPRQRLAAHVIRDQALAHSGLLVEKIGGPSVRPMQPDGLWKEMSNEVYRVGTGDDLYRRSLYTLWKRTVLPPGMAVMDAADRETCAISVRRTNTPLQALTLLNETVFIESARQLAERILNEGGNDPVSYAFRLITARNPTGAEKARLRAAYADYQKTFAADPDAAGNLLAAGGGKIAGGSAVAELAAAMTLANVLLNLDEAITRE